MAATNRRPGRPPVGPGGQKRSTMRHQVTARIPEDDYRLLRALAAALQTSQAEVITRALAALTASLPIATQRVVRMLQRGPVGRQQK